MCFIPDAFPNGLALTDSFFQETTECETKKADRVDAVDRVDDVEAWSGDQTFSLS